MNPLQEYTRKRDRRKTPEPWAKTSKRKSKSKALSFVIQEHHASHLHYDFRLEWEGVLKSWAVPKGPSTDPSVKRLAVQVEDHPLEYGSFEGTIPKGQYGAGEVYIWDRGVWEPEKDPAAGLKSGRLEFVLKGKKLKGRWVLFRTGSKAGKRPSWILKKRSGDAGVAEVPEEEPEFVSPQLATLVDKPPGGSDWLHEIKYDGYRIQAHVRNGRARLFTRNGKDWTELYTPIVETLKGLPLARSVVLDGELVWLKKDGRFDFQALQNARDAKDLSPLAYFVFDLLHFDGEDLRPLPLVERKKRLKSLLKPLVKTRVLFSDHVSGDGVDMFAGSCKMALEGIISKRASQPYTSGRGTAWLKTKCTQRQEFIIGGFTEGTGARSGFGALLLGVNDNGKLRYVGRVGTGFDERLLQAIRKKLNRLSRKRSPFEVDSPGERGLHWVKPELIAEVSFAAWTGDGKLRVPVFHGLRGDKAPEEIGVETPSRGEISISSPSKIIYPKEKLTKMDVAKYYREVAPLLLASTANRPLSLKRCPEGMKGECFYQKHVVHDMAGVHEVPIQEKKAVKNHMSIDSEQGLMSLVQMGAYEIHAWNCRRANVMSPDQIVFDFDPGPGVSWKRVIAAAHELKEILESQGLATFVKVTGGKGLHVHVPVKAIYSWDEIKAFAQTLAVEMARRSPQKYTAKMTKAGRRGKIFIDYFRNGFGATAVVPYSLRAKKISAVAMPISWDQLSRLPSADHFTLEKALTWLKRRRVDPWKDYDRSAREVPLLEEI